MKPSLLLIIRSGAKDQLIVAEALDAALVCSAFGMEVSLLFERHGLEFTEQTRLEELLRHALPGDFTRVMAHAGAAGDHRQESTAAANLEWLSTGEMLQSLQSHPEVLVT